MQQNSRIKNIGLRGVTVADTKISFIDGEKGILTYRGFRIEDLAEKSSFTETVHLLLNGFLPNRGELEEFEKEFIASREVPSFIFETFKKWPRGADPMNVLMASIPLLAMIDPELDIETREANVRKAIRLIAQMPVVMAAWHRLRSGLKPLPPGESLSHAANFLWQFNGNRPNGETSRVLDISMILQAEHTFNASTFACREVASTQAHMYAGVSAGVGALSGSLHGGANAKVMEMLFSLRPKVKSSEDVVQWVRRRLDKGEKIMGMGHAVYKTFDPRSRILKDASTRLSKHSGHEELRQLLNTIEEECHKEFVLRGKGKIKSNVDFHSGLVYFMMGIPMDFMTPMFAMSLAAGWCAHIIEEKFAEAQEKAALYSPQADYVGYYCGEIGCEYTPIEKRQMNDGATRIAETKP
jgi:citrate synthase